MDLVFLDASVLYSAAYRPDSKLLRLWGIKNIQLLTSAYAADEAQRNLAEEAQRKTLTKLLESMKVAASGPAGDLPRGIDLPAKDAPILLAAIQAKATHLLTGDKRHFGRYFGRTIEGVMILPPADYLRGRGWDALPRTSVFGSARPPGVARNGRLVFRPPLGGARCTTQADILYLAQFTVRGFSLPNEEPIAETPPG